MTIEVAPDSMGQAGMEVVMRLGLAMRGYIAIVTLGIGLSLLAWSRASEASPPQAFATPAAPTQTTLSDGRTLVLGAKGAYVESPNASGKRAPLAAPSFVARTHHTATVLPNGRVLIWGGLDSGDHIAPGTWFDAVDDTFSSAADVTLLPRAGHTATVLTDGRLLVTGGWNERLGTLTEAELWDYRTNHSELLKGELIPPRLDHSATLLADGRVLILGGYDEKGRRYADAALYEPSQVRFVEVAPASAEGVLETSHRQNPEVTATIPSPDVTDFAPDGLMALRFSTLMDARSLTSSVTLVGQEGVVVVEAVAAEGGRLLFVRPVADLYPGSRYTLLIDGAQSLGGKKLGFTAIGFSTAILQAGVGSGNSGAGSNFGAQDTGADAPDRSRSPGDAAAPAPSGRPNGTRGTRDGKDLGSGTGEVWLSTGANGNDFRPGCSPTAPSDAFCRAASSKQDGLWLPGLDTLDGHWRINGAYPLLPDRRLLDGRAIAPGSTALYGQVMRIDDTPVANVEVSIGDIRTRTDGQGVFVLTRIPAGRQQLVVDGTTANSADAEYGDFVMGVKVEAGEATPMPNVLYLPRIRAQDKVTISSPLSRDTVITHPELPGVEIHIPAGTVLKDRKGHAVTDLAVVPMPVDRAPFPPPINFPIFFVLEPGGLVIQGLSVEASKGVQILYPNMTNDVPGTRADLLVYDPMAGWDWYGSGHVTDDGKHVAPDQGVGLHTVMSPGYGIGNNTPPPDVPPPVCNTCPCNTGNGPGGGGPGGGGGPSWGGGSGAGCGDPIDLSSGLFIHRVTDLTVADVLPLDVTRTYRQGDVPNKRAFGVGTSFNYGMYLYNATGNSNDYYTFQVILPDGGRVTYNLVSGALNQAGATFLPLGSAGPFEGSRIEFKEDVLADELAFVLTMRNGFQYVFYGHSAFNNVMLGARDRFGNTIRVTNNAGVIRRITSPSGRYIDFTPDPQNRISVATDNTGRSVNYHYTSTASDGLLQYVQYPDTTTEQYTYDTGGNGRMMTVVDRRGNTPINNTYYPDGKVNTQTLAGGGVYTISYTTDANGKITAAHEVDPLSYVRDVTFDSNGYQLTDSRAVGTSIQQTTTYTRDALSRITAIVDASGRKTAYTYDARGNRLTAKYLAGTQIVGPHDILYTYTYASPFDLIHTVTDPLQHVTTYDYTNGCLTRITDPLGHHADIVCNSAGQPSSISDPLGHATTYGYDGYDLHTLSDALTRVTTFSTDALGRMVSAIDPAGNVNTLEYDSNGRIIRATGPLNFTAQFGYDGNGNVTSVNDPQNGLTQYGYDVRNRRTSRTDALNRVETWAYDFNSSLKSFVDRKHQKTQYTLDELNRRTVATYNDGSTTTYVWNARNQVTQIVDSGSGTISRTYDGLDRLTKEETPQGIVNYTYDDASRRLTMTPSGQAQITYGFDNADRLTSITQGAETVSILLDDANRRTKLTLPNGVYTQYGYDNADELTSLTYKNATDAVLGTLTYSYDAVGRRATQGGTWASEQISTATTADGLFNLANQQTSFNGSTVNYDSNGSMTQDALGRTYNWDSQNRLTTVAAGAVTWGAYTYDALGRRTTSVENLHPFRTYQYDGSNLVQETQGTSVFPILSGLETDEIFARTEAAGRRYFLTDGLGSTIALTDGTGAITDTYQYDPYGEVTSTGGSDNTVQYTGRENDGNGLYYYRNRYYSPSMKRFISEDPAGLNAGLNAYAYVGGSPTNRKDPYGLDPGQGFACAFQKMNFPGGAAPNCEPYYPVPTPNSRCFLKCAARDEVEEIITEHLVAFSIWVFIYISEPEVGLPIAIGRAVIGHWVLVHRVKSVVDVVDVLVTVYKCSEKCKSCDNDGD